MASRPLLDAGVRARAPEKSVTGLKGVTKRAFGSDKTEEPRNETDARRNNGPDFDRSNIVRKLQIQKIAKTAKAA